MIDTAIPEDRLRVTLAAMGQRWLCHLPAHSLASQAIEAIDEAKSNRPGRPPAIVEVFLDDARTMLIELDRRLQDARREADVCRGQDLPYMQARAERELAKVERAHRRVVKAFKDAA